MGPKDDRTMTHPFDRKPDPPETSWVPGSTAPQSYEPASWNPVSAPEGPPQNFDLAHLDYDTKPCLLFPHLEPYDGVDWSGDLDFSSFTDSGKFDVDLGLSTLRGEIKMIVTKAHNEYRGPLENIVQEMFEVCEDDAKFNDMCTYNAVRACYEGVLPVEVENEMTGQPWAQRGKDASDKYKRFLCKYQDISQLTREFLEDLASKEQARWIDEARRRLNSLSESPVPNEYFNHNPASPQRRPSARTPNRDLGSPQYSSPSSPGRGQDAAGSPKTPNRALGSPQHGNRSSPGRGQEAAVSPKTRSRSDEESNPKRVRRANEQDGRTHWVAEPSALPSTKGKEPYTSPRRAQTPPDLQLFSSDFNDSGTHRGTRPRSAESKPSQDQSKGKQPVDGSTSSKPKKGAARLRQTIQNQYRLNVVETNQMVPQGNLDPYDRIKYENAFKFLGGEHPMSYYVGLDDDLDHIIRVFKRHREEKGMGQFHVTKGRCDSDDDDIPKGCCPNNSKKTKKQCYVKFHADLLAFHGGSPKEYTDAFRIHDFFFRCVSRALTKILFQYCQENKIQDPIFYPNYLEEALIRYVTLHPGPEEGEGRHLAKTLGINAQQIEKRLIMLRAKQINQFDQQKELTDAQIIGTKREQTMNPLQTFPGNNAFHKLSPRFTRGITSWLISNKDKLTPQNRYPDTKSIERWLKIFEEEHPDFKSRCNRQMIERYCLRYQQKHFQKFPLLPQPNINIPADEPEPTSVYRPQVIQPNTIIPAEEPEPISKPYRPPVIVLSSDSE